MKAHDLGNCTSTAYDLTQCDGSIKNNDILLAGDTVGVLVDAWPVAVTADKGSFHGITSQGVGEASPELVAALTAAVILANDLSLPVDPSLQLAISRRLLK